MSDISLGTGNFINIQLSRNVKLNETLILVDNNETYALDIEIRADFKDIPDEYHEVFLNMLTSKYYGKVSFGDNPFSQCLPPKKKRWYQFWK